MVEDLQKKYPTLNFDDTNLHQFGIDNFYKGMKQGAISELEDILKIKDYSRGFVEGYIKERLKELKKVV